MELGGEIVQKLNNLCGDGELRAAAVFILFKTAAFASFSKLKSRASLRDRVKAVLYKIAGCMLLVLSDVFWSSTLIAGISR